MKKVRVDLKENAYKILIGHDFLSKLGIHLKSLGIGQDAVVITHPVIHQFYGKTIATGLKKSGFSVKIIDVLEGESSKSTQTAFQLMEEIAGYDCFKKIFIVALGGGVIGDLAGFVAAVYKRGISYVQVPTTFLAQIDSAIGGKVAIDLPVGKNLVGAFHQPRIVLSDVTTLSTLEERQIKNGLAEAVKYGMIYDKKLFYYLSKNYSLLLKRNPKALMDVVFSCSRIKAQVVVEDEKETKGIRTILNFGHTVGHAIEAAGTFSAYQHGEAVSLGMRIAGDISCQMKMFSQDNRDSLNKLLTDIGLPEKIKNLRLEDILNVMQHDKKFISGTNRFVLVKDIGQVKIVDNVPMTVITKAIKKHIAAF
ncbi:MAG TPA: 3-dehydroquinate synthase [Candidatus Omnitrophica bacterium]|nr:MAG: 3-dehydroquinate synthase [Omnitrophica WOR_2 bacterium GWA2_45_18]OGX19628.1 MAG: 3-dehydroquinate synthase [Omnitrophica WOR_2 bacterium GWC2_45_7]HBR14698.1 3-dehydroquinate synthase [Candidatus Omnitrophota bacterium]